MQNWERAARCPSRVTESPKRTLTNKHKLDSVLVQVWGTFHAHFQKSDEQGAFLLPLCCFSARAVLSSEATKALEFVRNGQYIIQGSTLPEPESSSARSPVLVLSCANPTRLQATKLTRRRETFETEFLPPYCVFRSHYVIYSVLLTSFATGRNCQIKPEPEEISCTLVPLSIKLQIWRWKAMRKCH